MPSCPKCSRATPAGGRFCPHCATPIEASDAVGRARVDPLAETELLSPRRTSSRPHSSFPSLDGARFLPGSLVGGRYRIVGMLGRGGMGEVYRADDLKLGQAVALKFLPEAVATDPERLRRFLNEVRLALRITHPAVCRVHDIGEVDGQHFISMEYVDGEDLASLLRRIGRLPQERAVEIARQLCAGLAAAHEEGILHRDLKPANIMIDGRGRAKITDFGLADLAGTVEGADMRAGTPFYMAPEQLEGRGVSERSDIYALGLVLCEIFTGKPAFTAADSVAEMLRSRQSATPELSSRVRGLDPAIEQAILRALSADPARRPASALALAAALPGGDPLAAALAAGETPSPEMVADAGEAGGMAPARVALALVSIVALTLVCASLALRSDALGLIETPLSVTALNERARSMIERLGYEQAPRGMAHGVWSESEYVKWLRNEPDLMQERVAAGRPAVYSVWHRESPDPLLPVDPLQGQASPSDPPSETPGMIDLRLDPRGRLLALSVVPPDHADPADSDTPREAADETWAALFREAGLAPERFTPATPAWTPERFADARAAWDGSFEEAPETRIRVEAAAYLGRPVSFRLVGPWTKERGAPDEKKTSDLVQGLIVAALTLFIMIGLTVLARRNLRQGRSDLKAALRLGIFIFTVQMAASLLAARYFVSPEAGIPRFLIQMGFSLFLGMVPFLAYVALEPYVRRLWPQVLISWTRLLSGRWRDPLVGRDLLVGALAGVASRFLVVIHTRVPGLLGLQSEPLGAGMARAAVGPLDALSSAFDLLGGTIAMPMLTLGLVVLLRLVLRDARIVVAAFLLVTVSIGSLGSPHLALDVALQLSSMALTLLVLFRVGLVALAAMWFADEVVGGMLTLDPASWLAPRAAVSAALLAVVLGYAAMTALGGRSLLSDDLLER